MNFKVGDAVVSKHWGMFGKVAGMRGGYVLVQWNGYDGYYFPVRPDNLNLN